MGEPRSDIEQMLVQIGTLYRLDARGRMLAVNEPGDPPAPRLFLGRTRQGSVWSTRHDLPEDLAAELDRLCRAEPAAADLEEPPECYEALRAVLGERGPIGEEYRGPCFSFPEQLPDLPGAVELTPELMGVLPPELRWIEKALPLYAPAAVALADGAAVALCCCSRIGEHACEAGLETLPAYRGRGHGAAVTALWARLVRARGLTPLYSTSWSNDASRAVARRLGLVLYGEDLSLS